MFSKERERERKRGEGRWVHKRYYLHESEGEVMIEVRWVGLNGRFGFLFLSGC